MWKKQLELWISNENKFRRIIEIDKGRHHGLNRCMDKGMHGFKRNVGLSILAYNLHRIGNVLIEKEKKEAERKQKRKSVLRKAA